MSAAKIATSFRSTDGSSSLVMFKSPSSRPLCNGCGRGTSLLVRCLSMLERSVAHSHEFRQLPNRPFVSKLILGRQLPRTTIVPFRDEVVGETGRLAF